MKLSRTLLILAVALFATWAIFPAGAAQRVVFMEHFTNASCPPCAAVNPSLRAMASGLTHDTLVAVAYHVWWPGVDPMYNYNTAEVQTRTNYYNVSGVPHARLDGSYGITPGTNNITQIRNYIRTRHAVPAPCTIDFAAIAVGETEVFITGTINAEEDLTAASTRLFAALIVDTIQYSSPPGSNGETLFDDVFRDMWPSATGEAISIPAGGSYDFEGTLTRQAAWDINDLRVVVWVQDYTTKVNHQAAYAHVSQNYGMETQSSDARQQIVAPGSGDVSYFIDLTNIGALDDIYDVNLEGTFPAGWSHQILAIDIPPDPDHIQVPVPSQGQQTIMVTINPNGNPGSVDFDVVVTTPNEPLLTATETFRLMSGLDILVVDDDQGGDRETWYMDALAASGTDMIYGRWDVNLSALSGNALTGADIVIWFTGDAWQDGTTLTAQDQIMLQDYLDSGGRLFLSGQGIGFDLRTDQFYSDYLHAVYRQNYATGINLLGIEGDPISDGVDLHIAGGDGANNQTRQSSNNPDASGFATPVFHWEVQPGQFGHPGLRVDAGTFRVVYLGFGFEAIDNATDRTTVMGRTLDWLMGTTSADNPRETLPLEFSLGQNYPNPFNPETSIPYMLPERARVTLHVMDILGREVATMEPGMQEAGVHAINWNASDLASGIYFYRLDAAAGADSWTATRKLILLK